MTTSTSQSPKVIGAEVLISLAQVRVPGQFRFLHDLAMRRAYDLFTGDNAKTDQLQRDCQLLNQIRRQSGVHWHKGEEMEAVLKVLAGEVPTDPLVELVASFSGAGLGEGERRYLSGSIDTLDAILGDAEKLYDRLGDMASLLPPGTVKEEELRKAGWRHPTDPPVDAQGLGTEQPGDGMSALPLAADPADREPSAEPRTGPPAEVANPPTEAPARDLPAVDGPMVAKD